MRESEFARALYPLSAENEADRGGQVTQMDSTKRDRSLVGTTQAAVVAEIEPDARTLREEPDRAAANVEARDIGLDRQERTARKRQRRRIEGDARIRLSPPDTKGRRLYSVQRSGSVNTAFPISAKVRPVLQPGRGFRRGRSGREHGDALDAKHPEPTSATHPPNWVGLGRAALLFDERRIPVEGGAEGRCDAPFGRGAGRNEKQRRAGQRDEAEHGADERVSSRV